MYERRVYGGNRVREREREREGEGEIGREGDKARERVKEVGDIGGERQRLGWKVKDREKERD